MTDLSPNSSCLAEGFRWFGPNDPVTLSYIRQAGASEIFSSLHQIPYGELWTREDIRFHKRLIESSGLHWTVVESVPVHEDIKVGSGNLSLLYDNYKQTLRNLAAEGIFVVVYNFMPALDWLRTDMRFLLADGSECLHFDPVRLAAFEIHALKRPGAEADFTPEQIETANFWWESLCEVDKESFVQDIIDVFPGVKWGLSLDDLRTMLGRYVGIDRLALRANLSRFLREIVPVAEEVGVRMAIHPDDPPFSILGLPRIVSTADDIATILRMADSPSNGLCFCTGSFGARPDNDLLQMVSSFGSRINAVHLRSTQLNSDGSFFEANHLEGTVDMPAVVASLLDQQDARRASGRADWRLTLRPDHGHTMMDDLQKPVLITPGYSCIGRMRGLAELRGLMRGLRHALVK